MKNLFCCLMVIFALFSLSACGDTSKERNDTDNNNYSSQLNQTSDISKGIDVDLTILSGTMVFSEVYNMTAEPSGYIGKIVRMKGEFEVYEDSLANKRYYSVIIADAAACCSQGLEFVLKEEFIYPQDYPKPGAEITVTGEFQTYDEDGKTYCNLINAELTD